MVKEYDNINDYKGILEELEIEEVNMYTSISFESMPKGWQCRTCK